jgi:hypothetical protein
VIVCPTKCLDVIIVEENGVNSGYVIGTFFLLSYIPEAMKTVKNLRKTGF